MMTSSAVQIRASASVRGRENSLLLVSRGIEYWILASTTGVKKVVVLRRGWMGGSGGEEERTCSRASSE